MTHPALFGVPGTEPPEPKAADAATSLSRAFDILGLFSLNSPLLRVDDLVTKFGYTKSTAYRYVRELCSAGLLTQRAGGIYSLGPRVVELERLLELTDPFLRAGRSVLRGERRDDSVLLLQELYRDDQVMCVYKEGPDELVHSGQRIAIKRARGLPFPLFRGAASLALLAWLQPSRIRQVYLSGSVQIAAAGLGRSWEDFRAAMAATRRKGYTVTRHQPVSAVVTVAAAIVMPGEKRVLGSVARVMAPSRFEAADEEECAAQLIGVGARIAQAYAGAMSS